MKKLVFLIASFCALTANAQNYLINFVGSGAATTVNSVKVENLSAGTSLTLNGSDILRLTGTVGINEVENAKKSDIVIYPNPMDEYSFLQIYPPETGNVVISVLDMTGKLVTQISSYLDNSIQEFRLSDISYGSYLISVKGGSFNLSAKLISIGQGGGTVSLEKMSNNQTSNDKIIETASKGELATVDMNYTNGDRLKFTGTSGIYSMIKMDIPEGSKTITFNFLACADGDGINYPVVDIGGQVWMAENLKTTKYHDGTAIPIVTDNNEWEALTTDAYCDYANTASNSTTYGRLYNWYVAASTNPKKVCPTGWHVPSDQEWTTMETYLIANSYNYDGTTTGNKYAKSLASHTNWTPSSNYGAVGNTDYPAKRNVTGFTALPGGERGHAGSFSTIGSYGYWWSSTEDDATDAWFRSIYYQHSVVGRYNTYKHNGYSVRCLMDN